MVVTILVSLQSRKELRCLVIVMYGDRRILVNVVGRWQVKERKRVKLMYFSEDRRVLSSFLYRFCLQSMLQSLNYLLVVMKYVQDPSCRVKVPLELVCNILEIYHYQTLFLYVS